MKLILPAFFMLLIQLSSVKELNQSRPEIKPETMKIRVEVWTDVMCPFCYIGKRKFEMALHQSGFKDQVDIRWRSFQLNPDMKNESGLDVYTYLAQTKGWTLEYSKEMHRYVSDVASQVGLKYDFDKAVIANSFDAHRLLQFAQKLGKGDQLSEALFDAYFCKGINTSNHEELIRIGIRAGLEEQALREMLGRNDFAVEVQDDIRLARQLGITGVPFFLFNDKYAVSGAQAPEVFVKALQQCRDEMSSGRLKSDPKHVCSPEKDCH